MGLIRLILTVFPTVFGPPGQIVDLAAANGEKAFAVAALTYQGNVGSLDLHCFTGQVPPGGTFNGTPGFFHIDDGALGPISDFATMRTTEGNLENYISWTKQEAGGDPALFIHIFRDGVCGGGKRFKATVTGGYSGSNTFPVGLASGTDRATGPTQIITAGWASRQFSAPFFKNIPGAPYPNQAFTFAGQTRTVANDRPARFPIFGGTDPTAGPLPEDGSWWFTFENLNPHEHRVQKWWGDEGPGTLQFDSVIAATPPPPFEDFRGAERATFGSGGRLDGTYFFNTGGVSHELKFGAQFDRVETNSVFSFRNDLDVRHAWTLDRDRVGGFRDNGEVAVQNRAGDLYFDRTRLFGGPPVQQQTTWNQSGPTDIWKIEDTHVFSSNFYLTGSNSFVGSFQDSGSQGFATAELIRDAFEFGKSRPGPHEARIGADVGVEQVNGCLADDTTDCVNGGRFRVRAYYKTPDGTRGAVSLRTLTDDTGYGFIFDPANIELVYKVLRACGINNQFWVFAAGLTNLAIDIEVFDILLGKLNVYSNPPRPFALKTDTAASFCERPTAAAWSPGYERTDTAADLLALDQVLRGVSDISPLPGGIAEHSLTDIGAPMVGPCVAGPTTLCLNQNRYEVKVTWRSTTASGAGQAVKLTADTGYNWFFDPANVELLVKVLDGCALNNRRWVFAAGLTNIEVTIDVRDTVTGKTQRYQNPQGNNFVAIADTGTFEC